MTFNINNELNKFNSLLDTISTSSTLEVKDIDIRNIDKKLSICFSKIREFCFECSESEMETFISLSKKCKNLISSNMSSIGVGESLVASFELGDRLYGHNPGTTPYILIFSKSNTIDPYSLIIDPIYNSFLEEDFSVYGLPLKNEKNFAQAVSEYGEFFKTVPKIKSDLDNKVFSEDTRIRFCKAGILHTLAKGKKIHFVLDSLDVDAVPQKTEKTSEKYFPGFHTSQELRFIYRLCKRNPQLSQQITFWKDDRRVPAPWEEAEKVELWSSYTPKYTEQSMIPVSAAKI